jgi:hypothetical protein
MSRSPSVQDLYVDQAMIRTRCEDRHIFAAYTPHGIHGIDSYFIRRIRSGYGSRSVLKREIETCPHLHQTIKGNLLDNLCRLWQHYVKSPGMTFVPEGSIVMVKDCEYDRPVGTALGPLSKWDPVTRTYGPRMLSDYVGQLGTIEWYNDSGRLSVCLRTGYEKDGLIAQDIGEMSGQPYGSYFVHERASFWDSELEVLEYAPIYPKYS